MLYEVITVCVGSCWMRAGSHPIYTRWSGTGSLFYGRLAESANQGSVAFFPRLLQAFRSPWAFSVITSYSIHYTKLYDIFCYVLVVNTNQAKCSGYLVFLDNWHTNKCKLFTILRFQFLLRLIQKQARLWDLVDNNRSGQLNHSPNNSFTKIILPSSLLCRAVTVSRLYINFWILSVEYCKKASLV